MIAFEEQGWPMILLFTTCLAIPCLCVFLAFRKAIPWTNLEKPILLYRSDTATLNEIHILKTDQEKVYLVVRDMANKNHIFKLSQIHIPDVQNWLSQNIFKQFGNQIECFLLKHDRLDPTQMIHHLQSTE